MLPAFCDSHTHIVYAGSREGEFVDKINGLSYEEIARRGGGILNSADRLHTATEQELYDEAMPRLHQMMESGTGAAEIKSGYGRAEDAARHPPHGRSIAHDHPRHVPRRPCRSTRLHRSTGRIRGPYLPGDDTGRGSRRTRRFRGRLLRPRLLHSGGDRTHARMRREVRYASENPRQRARRIGRHPGRRGARCALGNSQAKKKSPRCSVRRPCRPSCPEPPSSSA